MDLDDDGDGMSNAVEIAAGTNPSLRDSDGDTMPDAWEIANLLNPNDPLDALLDVADPDTAPIIGGLCFGASNGELFPTLYQLAEVDGELTLIATHHRQHIGLFDITDLERCELSARYLNFVARHKSSGTHNRNRDLRT